MVRGEVSDASPRGLLFAVAIDIVFAMVIAIATQGDIVLAMIVAIRHDADGQPLVSVKRN